MSRSQIGPLIDFSCFSFKVAGMEDDEDGKALAKSGGMGIQAEIDGLSHRLAIVRDSLVGIGLAAENRKNAAEVTEVGTEKAKKTAEEAQKVRVRIASPRTLFLSRAKEKRGVKIKAQNTGLSPSPSVSVHTVASYRKKETAVLRRLFISLFLSLREDTPPAVKLQADTAFVQLFVCTCTLHTRVRGAIFANVYFPRL